MQRDKTVHSITSQAGPKEMQNIYARVWSPLDWELCKQLGFNHVKEMLSAQIENKKKTIGF